jgi:lipopolysaccharide export system permease protein
MGRSAAKFPSSACYSSRVRPTLLDRMIGRELLLPLAVGLFAILQLLVVAQLLQLNEVVFSSAITLEELGRLTAALLPHFLVLAIPLAYMLGLQLALGRMALDREIIALSAAGTAVRRLYRVPAFAAVLLGLGVAALAAWAEPWGLREVTRVLNEVIKRNLQTGLLPGVFNEGLPRFTVYVADVDPSGAWRGVLIDDQLGDGAPILALAEEGTIADAGGDALTLRLEQGELHRNEPDGETVFRFRSGTFAVGVQESVNRKNRFAGVETALSYRELLERGRMLAAQGNLAELARVRFERWRRWAVPLACVCFAVLGVPIAVAGGGARGFAYLVTLLSFTAYYVAGRIGVALAERHVPALLAAFLPNLMVLAIGIALSVRLARRGVPLDRG